MSADEIVCATRGAEEARLEALSTLQVVGSGAEGRFDRIVRLAADLFHAPIAYISLIDRNRQWVKAKVGIDFDETPRSVSFCTHTIETSSPLIVLDALQDPRFADSPLVKGPPFIRFYAGAPLVTRDGHRLGALCVADTRPRKHFSAHNRRALADFAALVVEQMELRRIELIRSFMMGFADATELAIVATDRTGRIQFANRSVTALFGYAQHEMIGQFIDIIIPERMRGAHQAGLAMVVETGKSRLSGKTIEVTACRRDGTEFPVEIALSIWGEGADIGIGAIIRDISERRQRDARLLRLANHDTLTGLCNRRRFEDLLGEALAHHGAPVVILADLDGFKEVNDSLGHGIGDTLLQAVAVRIPLALPIDAIVARFGGDEFAILLPNGAGEDIGDVTRALLRAFASPFKLSGQVFQLGVSIGCACGPAHGQDAEELIASADFALYRAKKAGGRTTRVFEQSMREEAAARRAIQDELLRAVHNGELTLYYQPQVLLRSKHVFGAEALLRWNHPRRGLLAPGMFLESLESSSLATPVGRWVIGEACRQLDAWRRAGIGGIRIGVNVSPSQFRAQTLADDVLDTVAEFGLDPQCLEIEVTERTVLENDDLCISAIRRLYDAGIRVALDDFGTGYASLSALKRFPLTTLKIDRSFVTELSTNRHDASIARAMLAMGQDLGLEIIAEGIETEAQEALLIALGCEAGQGYRYGRPAPASEFAALLRQDDAEAHPQAS